MKAATSLRLGIVGAMMALMGGRKGRDRTGGRLSASAHRKKSWHRRLTIARGAGSISAKADILQLCNADRWEEAIAMTKDHERQCGERLFSKSTLEAWATY